MRSLWLAASVLIPSSGYTDLYIPSSPVSITVRSENDHEPDPPHAHLGWGMAAREFSRTARRAPARRRARKNQSRSASRLITAPHVHVIQTRSLSIPPGRGDKQCREGCCSDGVRHGGAFLFCAMGWYILRAVAGGGPAISAVKRDQVSSGFASLALRHISTTCANPSSEP